MLSHYAECRYAECRGARKSQFCYPNCFIVLGQGTLTEGEGLVQLTS
jgi:hypothetical protein